MKGENGDRRRRVRFQEDGREYRLPGFLSTDDLVLCGQSEGDLRAMMRRFFFRCVGEEV